MKKISEKQLNSLFEKVRTGECTLLEVLEMLNTYSEHGISLKRDLWDSFKSTISRYVYYSNLAFTGETDRVSNFLVINFDEYKTVAYCYLDVVSIVGVVTFKYKLKVDIK